MGKRFSWDKLLIGDTEFWKGGKMVEIKPSDLLQVAEDIKDAIGDYKGDVTRVEKVIGYVHIDKKDVELRLILDKKHILSTEEKRDYREADELVYIEVEE